MSTTKRTSDRFRRIGIDSRIGTDQHMWPNSIPEVIMDFKSPLSSITSILRSTLQMVCMDEEGYGNNPLKTCLSSDQLKSALNNVIVASSYLEQADLCEKTLSEKTQTIERKLLNREIALCYFNVVGHLSNALPNMEKNNHPWILDDMTKYSALAHKYSVDAGINTASELTDQIYQPAETNEIKLPSSTALARLEQLIEQKIRTSLPRGKKISTKELEANDELNNCLQLCKHSIAYQQVADQNRKEAEDPQHPNFTSAHSYAQAAKYYSIVVDDLIELLAKGVGIGDEQITTALTTFTHSKVSCIARAGSEYEDPKTVKSVEEKTYRETIQITRLRKLLDEALASSQFMASQGDADNVSVVEGLISTFNLAIAHFTEAESLADKYKKIQTQAVEEKSQLVEKAKLKGNKILASAEEEALFIINSTDKEVSDLRWQSQEKYAVTIKQNQHLELSEFVKVSAMAQEQLDTDEQTYVKMLEDAQTKAAQVQQRAVLFSEKLIQDAEFSGDNLILSSKSLDKFISIDEQKIIHFRSSYEYLKSFCAQAEEYPELASIAYEFAAFCGDRGFSNTDSAKPYLDLINLYEKSIELSETLISPSSSKAPKKQLPSESDAYLINLIVSCASDAARLCAMASCGNEELAKTYYPKQLGFYETARKYLEPQAKGKSRSSMFSLVLNNRDSAEVFEKMGNKTSAITRYTASKYYLVKYLIDIKQPDDYSMRLLTSLNTKIQELKQK